MNSNTQSLPSPAVKFLSAAIDAMPKTLGDRERSGTLNDLMAIAIKTRMEFNRDDHIVLSASRFRMRTCVGVFMPLADHWYYRACVAGGTYARMWEESQGMKPWKAAEAFTDGGIREPRKNQRMAPGLGLTLPSDDKADKDLQYTSQGTVWWCTSVSNEQLVLCAYAGGASLYGRRPEGNPKRRRTFTRQQWAELMQSLKTEAKAA